MAEQNRKLLVGLSQILEYLGIAKPTFYKFVKLRMPAVFIEGRWYAYTDNLDEFFKALTRKVMTDIPEEVE